MTIHKLRAVAQEITNPRDYFLGVDPVPSLPPTSVLQFVRRNTSHLDPVQGAAVHRRFVLIANLETSGYVILDGSTIPLHEGEGLLIFPFQSHHYARLSNQKKACWLFTTFEYEDPKELEPLRDSSFTYEHRDIQRLTRLTSLLGSISAGVNKGSAAPFELGLLLSGLHQRRRSYLTQSGGLPAQDLPNRDFLQKITLYVHRHLREAISVDDIAREVGLSCSRLRSRFKHVTGVSLGKYIRQTRIHKARGLLHSTDLNITQIAESCGFDSLFSFSRTFRVMTGMAPSYYRKNSKFL